MHVNNLSIVVMAIVILVGLFIPFGLAYYFKRKMDASLKPFFIGFVIFIVFALILESIPKGLLLTGLKDTLVEKPFLFALIGGLLAGIFEETGRLVAFKFLLKKELKENNNKTALMYGAGHGGFEILFILVFSMISNIVFSVLINTGNIELLTSKYPAEQTAAILQTFDKLVTTEPYMFALGLLERIPAVALHIALSVMVWFGVKSGKKCWLFFAAIVIHTVVDTFAGYMALKEINVFVIEACIILMSAAVCVLSYFTWKKECEADKIQEERLKEIEEKWGER